MADKRTAKQVKPTKERVRYEVYGMPIEGIIEGAMAPERDAAEAKARAKADTEANGQAQPPVWPSLEDLKTEGPRARPRTRR